MSNRRRTVHTSRSYAARLQRRPARTLPPRRPPQPRRWLRVTWLPAALAVTAEVGHLIAAYVEWPDPARGAYHVTAGALLGLVAAGVSMRSSRTAHAAGAVVAIAGPAVWLGTLLFGASPYHHLPTPAAVTILLTETALAALFLAAAFSRRDRA
jgi:hypothetical protein